MAVGTSELARYRDLAWLFFKHGLGDVFRGSELEGLVEEPPEPDGDPEALARDLEEMGPTFVKLGQLLSTRADLLPVPYLEALARLQDTVDPVPFEEVEAIVASELGVRLSKAFSEFEAAPLASASLGQVHRAALRDGRPVAVKVQRPDIRGRIAGDFEALAKLAALLDRWPGFAGQVDLGNTVDEMRRTVLAELDYTREAANLDTLAENLREYRRLVVPRPVADYSTSRVLTMELVRGRKITALGPLTRLDLDGEALAEELLHAYLKQVLVDGFFHADPHPGNVFVTDDGRLALLDLGMVARVAPKARERLLKLVLGLGDGDADAVAEQAIALGEPLDGFDEEGFRRQTAGLVVGLEDGRLGRLEMGKVMLRIGGIAGATRLRLPPELTLLGKTLLNLDQIGIVLDPDLDPNALIRSSAAEITRRHVLHAFSPSHLFGRMVEMKELVEQLPGRLNRILDAVARDGFRVSVDAIDEKLLIDGFQKIANRITAGLLLASLILGGALLARVPGGGIGDYPPLALAMFLLGAVGALLLVGVIVFDGRRGR
jgi:predicted unusual protein kinase regulating ubiquinone biosynthesis (AarF/ABC1/UbiB family)